MASQESAGSEISPPSLKEELRPLLGAHADVVANHLTAAGYIRTEPHAYAIELLLNPGGLGARWRLVDDFDFQPTEDKALADDERDLFIADGYSADHVRVVALTVAKAGA